MSRNIAALNVGHQLNGSVQIYIASSNNYNYIIRHFCSYNSFLICSCKNQFLLKYSWIDHYGKSRAFIFLWRPLWMFAYYCWETVEGKSAGAIGNNPQQHLSMVGVVVVRISFDQQIYRDKYILKGWNDKLLFEWFLIFDNLDFRVRAIIYWRQRSNLSIYCIYLSDTVRVHWKM